MESSLSVPLTEGQVFIAMILQLSLLIWFIVFPIILIRKLNYLIAILEDKLYPDNESPTE